MRFWAVCVMVFLAACDVGAGSPLAVAPVAAPPSGLRTKVVLVAAEDGIKAFDNATQRFAKDLIAKGGIQAADIQRFSAADRAGTQRTRIDGVLRGIGTLDAAPGQACLVFITGHGAKGLGVVFPREDDFMDPKQLDRALRLGCGAQPTVLIVSACYSGIFASRPLARDNRIILTAAHRDRPSFGCGSGDDFTFFDGCFLTAYEDPAARTWQAVAAAAIACVAAKENADDYDPSKPQFSVGTTVAGLHLPGVP